MRTTAGSALRWAAIISLQVSAGVHLALTPDHLEEKPYVGVLFAVGSGLLLAAAPALASPGRRTRVAGWATGAAVSAGMFAGFLASRTVGLPQGYREEFDGSVENVLGYVTLGVELVAVAAALLALAGRQRARAATGGGARDEARAGAYAPGT